MTKIVKNNVVSDNETSENFRFSAAVAGYGLLLKDSQYKGNMTWQKVADLANSSIGKDPDGYRKEFITLSEQARDLMHYNNDFEEDYRK